MALLEQLRVERSAGPTILSRRPVVRLGGTLNDAARLAEIWPELIAGLSRALAAVEVWTVPGMPQTVRRVRGGTERSFAQLPREIAEAEAAEAAGRLLAAIGAALMAAARAPQGACGTAEARPPHFLAYLEDWMDGVAVAAFDGAARLFEVAAEMPGTPPEEAAGNILAKVREKRLDPFLSPLVAAAEARGIPWRLLARNDLVVAYGQGRRQRWVRATLADDKSYASVFTSLRKDIANRMLRRAGFPVTEHRVVMSREEAAAAAEELGYPLVVKLAAGSFSKNTTLWVESREEAAAAYDACGEPGTAVLVERQVRGEPHRVTVANGHAVAAARQLMLFVVGDGRSTLRELIEVWDRSVARPVPDDYAALYPFDLDFNAAALARRLKEQDLGLDDVPKAGREVLLNYLSPRIHGGISVDVTDRIHPDIMRMAEEIAAFTELGTLGLDLITTDITKPLGSVPLAINEINACPHLRVHELADRPRQVGPMILAETFPEGDQGRIPVAVFFQPGGGAVLNVLEALLQAAGWTPGMADPETARVAGYTLRPFTGKSAHPGVAVLRDRRADAALFALRLNDLTHRGLPSDRAEVAAFPPGALAGGEPLLRQAARCLAGLPGELLLTALGEETTWLREACPHRRWIAVAGPETGAEAIEAGLAAGAEVVFSEPAAGDGLRAVLQGPVLRDLLADRLSPGRSDAELWALAALLGLDLPPAEVRRLALRREAGDALSA